MRPSLLCRALIMGQAKLKGQVAFGA